MFKDDIDALPDNIPSTYDFKLVLREQMGLVLKNLPAALLGTVFSSLCFLVLIFLTYDLTLYQKAFNFIWLVYHTLFLWLLWLSLQRIFSQSDTLSLQFVKQVFQVVVALFMIGLILGFIIFENLIFQNMVMAVRIEKIMSIIWIFFHTLILSLCWLSWKKIDRLFSHSIDNTAHPETDFNDTKLFVTQNMTLNVFKNRINYNTHYVAYHLLLIFTFGLACLWAIAIGIVITINVKDATQIIILMGLHFALLSGGISSLATFWRVYIAYVLPSIFMWTFILFYMNDTGLSILAFGIIVLLFFNIFFAKQTSNNILKAILIYLKNGVLMVELQKKTRQIEEASKAKTQLLASASHDLRQPVHALTLFLEALDDTGLDERQAQIVNYAKSANRSSREMLNTILDYAHLESGQMTAHFVATDLKLIIQNLINEFSIQARNKGLYLRFRSNSVWVMTDPTMLNLILRNLISNAIRYTDQGGVFVEVYTLPTQSITVPIEQCRIDVQDTGSGMTSIEIDQVFDSFRQLERNNVNNEGLGLGLAIVKGITYLLQTDIHVESIIGQGSKFSLVLPVCARDDDNARKKVAIDSAINKTVLIIDDDDTVLRSMQLLLTTWGCQTIAVKTVTTAVTAYKAYRPDIVLTDFRLANNETGDDVISAIRVLSQSAMSPAFIILTADTSPQLFTLPEALSLTILHKPIDPKSLRQCLQNITIH